MVEWGAWSLVMPGRRPPKESPVDAGGRPIHATALDGTRLAGAWFPNDQAQGRTILLLHGLAEDRATLLGRVPPLARRGWNVAALDARASGESHGLRGSFGAREADDLVAWLGALTPLAGPDPTFAAWGRSMGASTALKAAATDTRIKALILEAPYRDLKPAVAAVLRRLKIPIPGPFARLILLRARSLAGVALDRPRPIELAPNVHARVLILHGSLDPIAPIVDAGPSPPPSPGPPRSWKSPAPATPTSSGSEATDSWIGSAISSTRHCPAARPHSRRETDR